MRPSFFKLTGIAAALLAALGPARAAEPEVADSMHLDANALGVGLGYATSAGPRFGEYNGINEKGYYGVLDFNVVKRDEETGTWFRAFGRNVGLENFRLRVEQNRQGDVGYYIDFSRIPRFEPLTPVTGVGGIGTNNLTVPDGTLGGTTNGNHPLNTRRDALALGFEKFIYGSWDVQLSFKNEDKDGARIFGRGTTSTIASNPFGQFEFTPEPINSTTQQLEAKLNYTGTDLQMTGGYYGTLYNNQNTALNINGGLPALAAEFNPIALPPDNQSHQIYLAGGYGFTPTTRGTFKVAYAKQTQDDPFINVPLRPEVPVSNLHGKVDTTLVQAGVTSRPIPKLTLVADFRYQDRLDKTPQYQYGAAGSTTDGTNDVRSVKTTNGKLEASYALPDSFRLTGGIDYQQIWRNTAPVRIVSYRETTDELSYRVELRRMMSETLTGAVAYIHSDRGGSPFQTTVQNPTTTIGSNLIAPINLADRTRDKVRLSLNWMPTEPLSIQFFVDNAADKYTDRDGSGLGVRKGSYQNYSLDASYAFTPEFQATAWYSINNTSLDQTTCENASSAGVCPASSTDPIWSAALKSTSNNFGAGLRGKPHAKIDVGADVSYSEIKDKYDQQTVAGGAVPSIPTITTKMARVTVYGKYALEKNAGIRLDYIYDRFSSDDWTWQSWIYADGTRLVEPTLQKVNFFLVSYYYKWR